MDLTLLFASCLEYVGLNTLLVLELGHIYLGVRLIPDSHFRSVDDDKSFLLKKTAEGVEDILLIESTSFAKAEGISFESAKETALASLNGNGIFHMFLDVYRCRLEGFLPLPQLVKHDDRWVLSEEAGFSPYTVAPMFRDAVKLKNVKLPIEFWDFLTMDDSFVF